MKFLISWLFRGPFAPMKISWFIILLGACSPHYGEAQPPLQLATPDAQPPGPLEKPCARPARLAGKAMSAGEVERRWGRDRSSLAACAGRHIALVNWRRARDQGLANQKLPPPEAEQAAPAAAPESVEPFAALFGPPQQPSE